MTVFIGIDTGLVSGAWAAIDHHGKFLGCGDIPEKDGRIEVKEFRSRLLLSLMGEDTEIVVEDVFAMPKQGLASTARFMRAAGAIEAVCTLLATTHFVKPAAWKRAMGLDPDKNHSLERARELWKLAPLHLKKHHGRAEALLLAEWLRREMTI